jgi:hypothetical protein
MHANVLLSFENRPSPQEYQGQLANIDSYDPAARTDTARHLQGEITCARTNIGSRIAPF